MGQKDSKLTPDEREQKQRKRQDVIHELVQTEETYVAGLEQIVFTFLDPLEQAIAQRKPILTAEEVFAIFANVRQLYQLHQPFLHALKRYNISEDKYFSNIILHHIPVFKEYTEYVNNYNNSLTTLWRVEKKKQFQLFMEEAYKAPNIGRRDLPTFLITPIQRLPRYVLLLREIEKATLPTHKDADDIGKAVALVRELTDFVNTEKRYAEAFQKLLEIQSALSSNVNILAERRELVQEGDFQCKRKGKKASYSVYHFYLFNDFLLLTVARTGLGIVSNLIRSQSVSRDVKGACHLAKIDVRDNDDTPTEKFTIDLVVDGKEYVVKFDTQQSKDESISLLYTTRSKSHRRGTVSQFARGGNVGEGKGKEKEEEKHKPEQSPTQQRQPDAAKCKPDKGKEKEEKQKEKEEKQKQKEEKQKQKKKKEEKKKKEKKQKKKGKDKDVDIDKAKEVVKEKTEKMSAAAKKGFGGLKSKLK